jgi:acyl-coenzyme A thioesterase PaaI-like protein
MNGPRDDAFAALLGIDVERRGGGHTVATLTTDERHANPHGTVHGAVFYAVAGAAVAAAANDAENSGIISSVLSAAGRRWRSVGVGTGTRHAPGAPCLSLEPAPADT